MKFTPTLGSGSAKVSVDTQFVLPRITWTATCGAFESPLTGIVALPLIWNWVDVSDSTVRLKSVKGAPSGDARFPPPPSVVQSWTRAHW